MKRHEPVQALPFRLDLSKSSTRNRRLLYGAVLIALLVENEDEGLRCECEGTGAEELGKGLGRLL